MYNRRPTDHGSGGFTLIELLISMVIISVLVGLAIPQMGSTRERSYRATMKHDLKNLATAEEAYFTDHQTYAPSISQLMSGFRLSQHVAVVIDSSTATGWGATATHALTSSTCSIVVSQGAAAAGAPSCP